MVYCVIDSQNSLVSFEKPTQTTTKGVFGFTQFSVFLQDSVAKGCIDIFPRVEIN